MIVYAIMEFDTHDENGRKYEDDEEGEEKVHSLFLKRERAEEVAQAYNREKREELYSYVRYYVQEMRVEE